MENQDLKKWSTLKVKHFIELVENGDMSLTKGPYYNNDSNYRKANIVFDYTQNEIVEITKCAKDVNYFAEKYASVMTDDGIQVIKLRDYQNEILKGFAKPENRFSILLASRQVGKCLVFNELVQLPQEKLQIGKIYYNELRKQRKLNIFEKTKYFLYNLKEIFKFKQIILKLIQLIEYFEYRNINLDEKILNSIELNNIEIETDTGFKKASHIHITKPFEIYDIYLESNATKSLREMMNNYRESINFNNDSGEINLNETPLMSRDREPDMTDNEDIHYFTKGLSKNDHMPFSSDKKLNWALSHDSEIRRFVIPIGSTYNKDKPDLSCADTHIVFDKDMNEVFVKDLKNGDLIQTKRGLKKVLKVVKRKQKVSMFDITVDDNNHRFYSNDILSHNTIMSALYIAHYILFNYDRNAFLIANIQKTSKEIMDKVKVIIENLPFFLKPGIIKNDVMEMKFDNGCRLITGSTTKRSGISFTIHMLFLDEFAHVADNIQKDFYYNIYPTVSSSKISRIIITSTPNGFNLFHDLYTDAEKGKNEYVPYKIDWWDVPGRDQKWYEETVANLGGSEEAFNIQYGNSFITADGRLLSPNHIERLEKGKQTYILKEFEELLDLDLDYEKYLLFKPGYNIERVKNKSNFFLFSIDIAEGGGGSSDNSVINIFEIDIISETFFNEISNPTSFQDFFGLKQIGRFKSNELSIGDFCKVAYILMINIFYAENVKLVLELNTYGGEFIKTMQTIFPGTNEFDEEIIVKFKQKADSNVAKMGLKIRLDNKPIMAQKFKKYYHVGKIEITEEDTVMEAISFGKDKGGHYKGLMGHDDLIMTCINAQEFLSTMDFADFIEELYENLDIDIKNKINNILELIEADGDSLNYDLYSLIGENDYFDKERLDEFDIF